MYLIATGIVNSWNIVKLHEINIEYKSCINSILFFLFYL